MGHSRPRSLHAVCAALALVVPTSCGRAGTDVPVLRVAAASSLRQVLEESVRIHETEHPEVRLVFSFDASSTLARQIEAGARYDVFLSADEANLARVDALLVSGTETTFLSNQLAVIGRPGLEESLATPAELARLEGRIAVSGPEVPAGRYTRAWLEANGLLDTLAPRFVNGRNARATLSLVESGAADFGFVYVTDHAASDSTRLFWTAPEAEEPRVAYRGAVLAASRTPRGEEYLRWLRGPGFQGIAVAAGFQSPPR